MSKTRPLVICVKNDGYPVSLERRKISVEVPEALEQWRVIDESGEDYVYPVSYFMAIDPLQDI